MPGGEQEVGPGEDGDRDGPAAIQAGGSASVGSISKNVQRKKIIVITITYRTTPSVNAASAANATPSPPSLGQQQGGEHSDRLGRHGQEEPGAIDA